LSWLRLKLGSAPAELMCVITELLQSIKPFSGEGVHIKMNFGFDVPMLCGFQTHFIFTSNIGKAWEGITGRCRIAPGIGFGLNVFTNSVDSKMIFLLIIGKYCT